MKYPKLIPSRLEINTILMSTKSVDAEESIYDVVIVMEQRFSWDGRTIAESQHSDWIS
jgi:hypothetical protein